MKRLIQTEAITIFFSHQIMALFHDSCSFFRSLPFDQELNKFWVFVLVRKRGRKWKSGFAKASYSRALHASNLFTHCYESMRTKFCRVHTWEFKLPMIWTRLSDENKNNRLPWGLHVPMCDQSRCHSGKLNEGNYCLEHSNLALVDRQYTLSLSYPVRSGVALKYTTKCTCVDLAVGLIYKCWKIWLKKNTGNWPRKKIKLYARVLSLWISRGFWMLNRLKCGIFELKGKK